MRKRCAEPVCSTASGRFGGDHPSSYGSDPRSTRDPFPARAAGSASGSPGQRRSTGVRAASFGPERPGKALAWDTTTKRTRPLGRPRGSPAGHRTAPAGHGLVPRLPRRGRGAGPGGGAAPAVGPAAPAGTPLRDLLHGRQLGHPLHPALVQVPTGAWLSAAVLDLLPGTERAARTLVGVGVLAAAPATLSGWVDWAEQHERQPRTGVVHAASNVLAVGPLRRVVGRSGPWPHRARPRPLLHRALRRRRGRFHRRPSGVPAGHRRQQGRAGPPPRRARPAPAGPAGGIHRGKAHRQKAGGSVATGGPDGRDRAVHAGRPLQPCLRPTVRRHTHRRLRRMSVAPQRLPTVRRSERVRPRHRATTHVPDPAPGPRSGGDPPSRRRLTAAPPPMARAEPAPLGGKTHATGRPENPEPRSAP